MTDELEVGRWVSPWMGGGARVLRPLSRWGACNASTESLLREGESGRRQRFWILWATSQLKRTLMTGHGELGVGVAGRQQSVIDSVLAA